MLNFVTDVKCYNGNNIRLFYDIIRVMSNLTIARAILSLRPQVNSH